MATDFRKIKKQNRKLLMRGGYDGKRSVKSYALAAHRFKASNLHKGKGHVTDRLRNSLYKPKEVSWRAK
jgi:hypothetical protein